MPPTIDPDHPEFIASRALATTRPTCQPSDCTPYDYQRAGVEYAVRRKDTIIGDEMGVGKTIQALLIANDLLVNRVLIVCPASLRINWRREAERWLVLSEAVVVGYEEAVLHPERVGGDWPLVIFDEAQYLKNPEAKRTQLCLSIPAGRRVFLTGTPILNKPRELWPILYSIDRRWGDLHAFGMRYCNGFLMKMGPKRVWNYDGAANLKELQWKLRVTCMIRRLKKDVLPQLPPKVRQMVVFPSKLASLSRKLLKKAERLAHSPQNVRNLSEEREVLFEQMSELRHQQALEKVPLAIEWIKEHDDGEPLVLFAHHRDVIDALYAGLTEDAVVLMGGMTDEAKQRAVDAFQDGSARIFIGQIRAAGVGLTLTRGSRVVFCELDWTPGNMAQAEDRCHRVGQEADSVHVVHLVLDGSLDARMSRVLVEKQDTITQALDAFDWAAALTED